MVAFAPELTIRCVSTSFAFCSASSIRIPYMAPEAPEIPTTMRRVTLAPLRRGSCPGVGGSRARAPSPYRDAIASCASERADGAPGHPRIARNPRSPVPPAARRIAIAARSGRIALGRFFGCPMAHTHITTPIAKQGVDLSVVGQRFDDLTYEQNVIAARALVVHAAPQHCQAASYSGRGETGLLDHGNLQRRELVR